MRAPFSTLAEFESIVEVAKPSDGKASTDAAERNTQLTKPPQALGRLEELAIWYAGWRGTARPLISKPQVIIFAGNHGVAARGVSAFPPEVTAQMVLNFEHGGAAINQLSEMFGAKLDIHALSLETPTADFTSGPAMSEIEVIEALAIGWNAVDGDTDLLVTGEMGIGNTTSASAILNAVHGGTGEDWTGRGTGVSDSALAAKTAVVNAGLAENPSALLSPLEALRCLGGREIAAMSGAIARARVENIPVILDGFICAAAASVLHSIHEDSLDHAVAGHVSAEGAHANALEKLGKEPLLDLGLRLGEGSGAALAIGILKGAIACHSGMSTFAEAGVTDG